ncbi:MAG: SDR family oxidoreductase [Bacteroidales bacterium]|nr:SDR family oxidoreductase [Bacteroidales bacterium]
MEQNLFGSSRILVTGASGIVGSHLIVHLLRMNAHVRAFVRNEHSQKKACEAIVQISNSEVDGSSIEWTLGEISNYDDVLTAMQSCDYVFHCAGFVSFQNSQAQQLYTVNVVGTRMVVNAALDCGITKLCHVSSVAAIGKAANNGLINETCDYNTQSKRGAYQQSKYEAEMEVWRGIAEGLCAVIVNPSIIVGASTEWQQSSASTFTTIKKGMPFYTSGITGYVGAHDVARSMIALMASEISGERFIVSAENLDYKTFFSLVAQSVHAKKPHTYIPQWLVRALILFIRLHSFVTRKPSQISANSARSAYSISRYNSSKLCSAIDFQYTPLQKVIAEVGALFLTSLPSAKAASNKII